MSAALNDSVVCSDCDGSGSRPERGSCPHCYGLGWHPAPLARIGDVVVLAAALRDVNPYVATFDGRALSGPARRAALEAIRDDVNGARDRWVLVHAPAGGPTRVLDPDEVAWSGMA